MFWTNLAIYILLTVYVIDCLFMGLVILMQRSKQEGLGAAFGGSIMSEFAGAQTSAVLVKATVYAAIIFFALSITLARLYAHINVIEQKGSPVQQLLSQPVPKAATPTPAAPAVTPTPAPVAPTPSAATTPPSTTVPPPVTPTTAKPAATPPPAAK